MIEPALNNKHVCHACIGEQYLSNEIKNSNNIFKCDYCKKTKPSISIEELSSEIEKVFEDHYKRTESEPDDYWYHFHSENEKFWERDGEEVIYVIESVANVKNIIAVDILKTLQECNCDIKRVNKDYEFESEFEFDSNSHYMERSTCSLYWFILWHNYEKLIKTRSRFFNDEVKRILAEVFSNIDKLKTHNNNSLVVDVGPQTELEYLYRARSFQDEEQLKKALARPDKELGPPSHRYARAGRMNAQGVSVFYGATKSSIAIAEVRPPVGGHVAIAKFKIIRKLKLLDLTLFEDARDDCSLFDPSSKARLERVAFLASVAENMSRPVMPNDEALNYVLTQAIADFLATMNKPLLDGIIFPSIQTKDNDNDGLGKNVVLFNHASMVETMDIPQGTNIEVSTGYSEPGEWYTSYSVIDKSPEGLIHREGESDDQYEEPASFLARREPVLQVDIESIFVHHVDMVKVSTKEFKVSRYIVR